MKIVYYKLPDERGENVLVSELPLGRDVELAMLLEVIDLHKSKFVFESMDGVTNIEAAEDDDEPYFYVNGQNFDGILPFDDEIEALHFVLAIQQRLREIDEGFDEE